MPRKISLTTELKTLEQQRRDLKGQIKHLLEEQRGTLLRNSLLSTWCDSLSLLQVPQQQQQQHDDADADATPLQVRPHHQQQQQQEGFAALLQQELAALQQLATTPNEATTAQHSAGSTSMLDASDVLHPGVATIAPPGDALGYLRHHMFQPPVPEAATVTAGDLARVLRETTLQGSVLLHCMQGKPQEACAGIVEQMQQQWDRVMHLVWSLIILNREDIVETMNLINLDTLQPDPEGSSQVAAQAAQTVQRLQLTEQQQTIIATGSAMYVRLLERVMRERQQLQLQFTSSATVGAATEAAADDGDDGVQDQEQQGRSAGALASAAGGGDDVTMTMTPAQKTASGTNSSSSTGPSSSSGSGSGSADSVYGGGSDSLGSIHARLEAEQRRMARLQLLMQKEYILRMAGLAWVVGCLSWEQVTRAAVLSWPFPVRFSLLAQQIQKQWEQRQAHGREGQRGQHAQEGDGGSGRTHAASPDQTCSGAHVGSCQD